VSRTAFEHRRGSCGSCFRQRVDVEQLDVRAIDQLFAGKLCICGSTSTLTRGYAFGQQGGERAEAGAHFEHNIVGGQRRNRRAGAADSNR